MQNLKAQKEMVEQELSRIGKGIFEVDKDIAEFKNKKERFEEITQKEKVIAKEEKRGLKDIPTSKGRIIEIDKKLEELERELLKLHPVVKSLSEEVLIQEHENLKARSLELKEKSKLLTYRIALSEQEKMQEQKEVEKQKRKRAKKLREKMRAIKLAEKQLEMDLVSGKIEDYSQYYQRVIAIQNMKKALAEELKTK